MGNKGSKVITACIKGGIRSKNSKRIEGKLDNTNFKEKIKVLRYLLYTKTKKKQQTTTKNVTPHLLQETKMKFE
jgi:hypothetical protein